MIYKRKKCGGCQPRRKKAFGSNAYKKKKEKAKHKKSEGIVSSPTHAVINIKENLPERGERKTKENVDKR